MKARYSRISDDVEENSLGVTRQDKDNRTLCSMREWKSESYVDNDLSAYRKNVVRPEFERMIDDLRAGRIDGIVAYNLDRLFRQPRDLERVIDIYDEKPGLTFATVEGDINLASADGRTMARVMVAFANKASADTGRRTKRKHLELAQAGEPVGRRMFGWQQDLRTLDPVEAGLARKAVDEVIAGTVGVRELVRRWSDAGVMTTTGKDWSHQGLRQYLLNPRLAGVRSFRGEVVLNEDGMPVRGTWEPLLDQDTFDRLQLAIGPVKAGNTTGRRGSRKYLLSGLLRCGICSGFMYGGRTRGDDFAYSCSQDRDRSEVRHRVAVTGRPVDRLVSLLVLRRLSGEPLEAKPVTVWPGEDRLSEIDGQIKKMMDAFLAGELSERIVFPRVETLEVERSDMQNDRAQWLAETTGPVVRRETAESWDGKTIEQRRALMDKVLSAVYVRPVTRRGVFDPDRLRPVWREGQPAPLAVVR